MQAHVGENVVRENEYLSAISTARSGEESRRSLSQDSNTENLEVANKRRKRTWIDPDPGHVSTLYEKVSSVEGRPNANK